MTVKDLRTGMRFHKLVAVSFDHRRNGRRFWLVRCDCGNQRVVCAKNLTQGATKSCGCTRSASIQKHGYARGSNYGGKTREYSIWLGIKKRCYNSSCVNYKHYGARGVKMCDQWLNSFENFLSDVGFAPSNNHSIDRINVNGDYEPGNVKWSTPLEQANNTTRNFFVDFNGEIKTLSVWCSELGLNYHRTKRRLYKGYSPNEAFQPGIYKPVKNRELK